MVRNQNEENSDLVHRVGRAADRFSIEKEIKKQWKEFYD
jgi:hypothetical protein